MDHVLDVKLDLDKNHEPVYFESCIFGIPALTTFEQIILESIPEGFYYYQLCEAEVRGPKRRTRLYIDSDPNALGVMTIITPEPISQNGRKKRAVTHREVNNGKLISDVEFFNKYQKMKGC